jgi:hypothetical protein
VKRVEKNIIIIISLVSILLLVKYFYNNSVINSKGVYVLGKVTQSTFGGDAGWAHKIFYNYANEHFEVFYTGSLRRNSDSLLFLRINPVNGKEFRIVDSLIVSSCFQFDIAPDSGWSQIPICK